MSFMRLLNRMAYHKWLALTDSTIIGGTAKVKDSIAPPDLARMT